MPEESESILDQSTVIEYVGLLIDSEAITLSIPERKFPGGGICTPPYINLRTDGFGDLGMVLFEFLAKIIVEKHYLAGVGLRFKKF